MATLMFEQGYGADLVRLNDAERQVLLLLAEGHTAKSIANELGSTPAAVNERLREARRKTGVGSSRELARLLKSQENRHDELGMASSSPVGSAPLQSTARSRSRTGVVAMVLISLVAAAGAAALLGQQPVSKDVDPLLGTPVQTGPDPAALHSQIRAESRDADWAGPTERAILARALQIPLVGKDGNALRVTCATKLCEIAGSIKTPAAPPAGYDPKRPESRAISALQTAPFVDDLSRLGLRSETGLFTGSKDDKNQVVYLLYYSRK